jgi:hypothetical protein
MSPAKKKGSAVYQFKIVLEDIEPPVWRRIQIPSTYSFWDLHIAIQDAMGWTDTHLHEFVLPEPKSGRDLRIGIPDEDLASDSDTLPGWKKKISAFFIKENTEIEYTYDFGDNWIHSVIFERSLPPEEGTGYPKCIGGERACPPEDCGGPDGYQDFLEAIMDPNDHRHDELLDWVDGDFSPEEFDCAEVIFDNPAKRLKMLKEQF